MDRLLGFFSRLPRLPKLASADVPRNCLSAGVASGVFGLVSGSTWHTPDAVRRFKTAIDPTEVQFRPGTWLVRAATVAELMRDVVKVAVSPLIATGATVTVKLEVLASHPKGIPYDTLDLAVKEGLRQLNIDHHVTPN